MGAYCVADDSPDKFQIRFQLAPDAERTSQQRALLEHRMMSGGAPE